VAAMLQLLLLEWLLLLLCWQARSCSSKRA
jgi:hypothetical protein